MIEVLEIVPRPLLTLVVEAFETLHERTELWPTVIEAGVATKLPIVGAGCAIVAAQVVVATEDEASVACKVIVYMPNGSATTCVEVVVPLPQRNATGATPPLEEADHVMFVALGVPVQEAVRADAAPANPNESMSAAPSAGASTYFLMCII